MTTEAVTSPRAKRRILQFSLRKLMLFVTAFACVMAWYAYERREAAAARASLAPLLNAGAHIGHVDEPKFNWRLFLFGDNPRQSVEYICLEGMDFSEGELAPLTGFKSLRNLRLSHTKVSDASLIHLEQLRHLEVLSVRDTKISPSGMKRLKGVLTNCQIRTSPDEE